MPPTLGLDCELILDGAGYWIEPGTYRVQRPRAATGLSAGMGHPERNVDFGPAKREWSFTVVAHQAIRDFAGRAPTLTGQQYRDSLVASYAKLNTTLQLTDPHGDSWSVRFDQLEEEIADIRAQPDGELQYYCRVTLRQATDLSLTLDGGSYWIVPGSYGVTHPRAASPHSAGLGHTERNIDFGPARKQFQFASAVTAVQMTALRVSYQKVNTSLNFVDPNGTAYSVRLVELDEDLAEVRPPPDNGLQYYARIVLREATDMTVTLDGSSYWVEPGSFVVKRPRVRSAVLNRTIASAGGGVGERLTDQGPAKREWIFTVQATQAVANSLTTSYEKVAATMTLVDPNSVSWTVRFDDLTLELAEVTAASALQYYAHLTLREA